MAESKRHQDIVKNLCLETIKKGIKPEEISISGIQNPALKRWSKRKGIIFDEKQEVDILRR